MKQHGHENKENDRTIKKFVIVKQILLVSNIGNVPEAVWIIYTLKWGC